MLIDQLTQDMKAAMKARESLKLAVLRLTLSELKNARIARGQELEEAEVIQVLRREVKRREEAAEQYRQGNRRDLTEQEEAEARILESYLPKLLEGEALEKAVDAAIAETGATGPRDMGKVMKAVLAAHAGQVDGRAVQELVKGRLVG